jgi:hypothetical protein
MQVFASSCDAPHRVFHFLVLEEKALLGTKKDDGQQFRVGACTGGTLEGVVNSV